MLIDLFTSGVRLFEDGRVLAEEERRMDGGADGWTVAAFRVETDEDVHGDHWEMHPAAEELVSVLSGAARMYLRPERDGAPEEMVPLAAGSAFVVPRGRWHRLELDRPSDLMSITLRRGTRLERRTAG
ncbi:cupin domain-containing protein [Spirillospora sp. NPDC050679]